MADAETTASKPETGNHGVQLGIGTLIIIALIVTMCSGRGEMEKIQKDTAQIKQQLAVMEGKLDALAAQESATAATSTPGATAPATEAVESTSVIP
ncbi:MAG: hypothetical protein K0Q92_1500 [Steroidobacteraceae bacterium]|jgi:uncharacterized membrane protein (DUF441 family)|nr:hypothetical protein [Steroidobacteraceae bacterium]